MGHFTPPELMPFPWSTTSPPLPREGGKRGGGSRHRGIGKEEEHDLPNTIVYNTRYDEALWKGLSGKARPMRGIIKFAKALGLYPTPPPRDAQKEA